MNAFQSQLAQLSEQLDKIERGIDPPVIRQTEWIEGGWVVIKTVGETQKTVGFNLCERDARILAASQQTKVMPSEDQDFLMISFRAEKLVN